MQGREKVTIGHLWGAIYPALIYMGMVMIASAIFMFVAVSQGQVTVTDHSIDYGKLEGNF